MSTTLKKGDLVTLDGKEAEVTYVYASGDAVNLKFNGHIYPTFIDRSFLARVQLVNPPATVSTSGVVGGGVGSMPAAPPAAAGTPDDFLRAAVRAVNATAKEKSTFTTDDVWAKIGTTTNTEPRALGGVMIEMAKSQVIRNTGRFQKSTRKACHSRPVAIWESLVK
jgi:hypothetical protein